MKSLRIFTYLLMSLCAFVQLQAQEIDELQENLKNAISPQQKAELFGDIGLYYFHKQVYFDSVYFYTKKSLQIAEQYNVAFQRSRATFNLGAINNMIGKRELALQNYKKFILLVGEDTLTNNVAAAYTNIGGVYFELKRYPEAIDNYKKDC